MDMDSNTGENLTTSGVNCLLAVVCLPNRLTTIYDFDMVRNAGRPVKKHRFEKVVDEYSM